jgi:hypothetical protein
LKALNADTVEYPKNNLEADKKAYTTMMRHLKEIDEAGRTVILMQVEKLTR